MLTFSLRSPSFSYFCTSHFYTISLLTSHRIYGFLFQIKLSPYGQNYDPTIAVSDIFSFIDNQANCFVTAVKVALSAFGLNDTLHELTYFKQAGVDCIQLVCYI